MAAIMPLSLHAVVSLSHHTHLLISLLILIKNMKAHHLMY